MQFNKYTHTHTHTHTHRQREREREREEREREREISGSVDVNPEDVENIKKAGREVYGAQGLGENCRDSAPPLSHLIRGFRHKYH